MIGNRFTQYYYEYKIATGGKNWVIGAFRAGMPADKYIAESEDWQKKRRIMTIRIKGGFHDGIK